MILSEEKHVRKKHGTVAKSAMFEDLRSVIRKNGNM